MKILLAEDEELLAESIAEWLRGEDHAVDVVLDGDTALDKACANHYDVIVLDRDLPVVHGDDVCRSVVLSGFNARILMLTAAAGLDDRVAGLEIGADDYLAKPFAFKELSARVFALGRRSRPAAPPTLRRRGVTLDMAHRQAFYQGRYLNLSKKEYGLLRELMLAEGAPVSSEHLLEKVWDENADPFTSAVRIALHKLRRKLDADLIETVPGLGYRIA
ncbi:response regulator transcription factor [Haloglycomyces albus]|uniref:response regulator transcription factor n=1 Tax=Haloglycomyces albus TaxID=526067 RepID=UPI00046D5417|nr:response regulator transcription factor [Haloglycomyces albus]